MNQSQAPTLPTAWKERNYTYTKRLWVPSRPPLESDRPFWLCPSLFPSTFAYILFFSRIHMSNNFACNCEYSFLSNRHNSGPVCFCDDYMWTLLDYQELTWHWSLHSSRLTTLTWSKATGSWHDLKNLSIWCFVDANWNEEILIHITTTFLP